MSDGRRDFVYGRDARHAYRFTPPQPVNLDAAVRLIALMMDSDVRLVCGEVVATVIDAKHKDLLTKVES